MLLLVVTLLVMFLLIGVTGVIVATTFHTSARSATRQKLTEVRNEDFTDRVIMQLIRGTDARSALWGHDLLGDLYGSDSVSGTVQGTLQPGDVMPFRDISAGDPRSPYDFNRTASTTQAQVLDINVTLAVPATTYYMDADHFVGRLFTFTDGPSAGISTRILQFNVVTVTNLTDGTVPGNQVIYRIVIDGRGKSFATSLTGNRFVINGQPFNGTGVGYKTAFSNGIRTSQTDAVPLHTVNQTQDFDFDQDGDIANEGSSQVHTLMLPNFRFYVNPTTPTLWPYLGGADEPWDAVDLNNFFLSWTQSTANGGNAAQQIIPSFYRQQLIRYLRDVVYLDPTFDETPLGNDIGDLSNATAFIDTPWNNLSPQQRAAFWMVFNRAIIRPHWNLHPNFTGGNNSWAFPQTWTPKQYLNQLAGDPVDVGIPNTLQWDADTDGDQIPDSIWIDPGLPVQTDRNGKRFKVLAAIQVKDLNAHINVNTISHSALVLTPLNPVTSTYLSVQMPPGRGTGYGPAEITPIFTSVALGTGVQAETQLAEVQSLLIGNPILGLQGRYGGLTEVPGLAVPGAPLATRSLTDSTNLIPFLKSPAPYPRTDLPGMGQVGFDLEGQPLYVNVASQAPEISPYAYDPLKRNQKYDAPFTEAELERVLRRSDVDGSINPGRLERLASNTGLGDPLPTERRPITTISTHVPVAGQLPTVDQRRVVSAIPQGLFSQTTVQLLQQDPRTYFGAPSTVQLTGNPIAPTISWTGSGYASNIQTMLYTRSLGAQIEADTMGTIPIETKRLTAANFARTQMPLLVPFELRHGYAMNVNRPFGNGADDNLDGQTDVVYWNASAVPPGPAYEDSGARAFVDSNRPIDGMGNNSIADRFPNYGAVASDFLNGETVAPNAGVRDPRILYARNLYCAAAFSMAQSNGSIFRYVNDATGARTMQRLAQWAINCAEFRDPDGIMTAFEYDANPFDGWDVNGVPGFLVDGLGNTVAGAEPTAGLVWGCEQPELLLTESIATHDRRVADTTEDPSGQIRGSTATADQDLDQQKFPQGSLYLELYCPRPRLVASQPVNMVSYGAYPQDLYNGGVLDLDRMAPPQPGFPDRARPVWRIAISTVLKDRTGNAAPMVTALPPSTYFNDTMNANRDDVTYQPENMVPSDPQFNLNIEREIWFTTTDPTLPPAMGGLGLTAAQAQSIFYNRTATTALAPGNYLVIGPRTATSMGTGSAQKVTFQYRTNYTGTAPDLLDPNDIDVFVTDTAGTKTGGGLPPVGININNTHVGNVQPMETMVCASNLPTGWNPGTNSSLPVVLDASGAVVTKAVGINVSMPLVESNATYWSPANEPVTAAEGYNATTYPDQPLDEISSSQLILDNIFTDGATPSAPIQTTGTYLDYKVALLQRLANPLLPWNPSDTTDPSYNNLLPMNPYITVDSLGIDLTVFNGEDTEPAGWNSGTSGEWDPYGEAPPAMGGIQMRFATREKGNSSTPFVATMQTTDPPVSAAAAGTGNFAYHLTHTLGFLNDALGGASRNSVNLSTTNYSEFFGAPPRPFPWLTWYNRPFSSPGEVMLVPATSAGRLFHEYGDIYNVATNTESGAGPYAPGNTALRAQIADYLPNMGVPLFPNGDFLPFPHLLNFFHSSSQLTVSQNPSAGNLFSTYGVQGPDLSRLMDLLAMPGPFMGNETWYQPNTFSNAPLAGSYRPPFNFLPNFREAGRLNLNTLGDVDTNRSPAWDALTANLPRAMNPNGGDPNTEIGSPLLDSFYASRKGTGIAHSPETINNPFRPTSAADLMPNLNIPRNGVAADGNWTGPGGTALQDLSQLGSSGVGLTRPDPTNLQRPLFHLPTGANVPANPATRLHGMNRLYNLTTNQGNSYAVWVALGKFEVEYVGPSPTIPDGYMLGAELGYESGTQQRHRSFFIIDRTVPVAYETGKNHNASQTILLKRFLE